MSLLIQTLSITIMMLVSGMCHVVAGDRFGWMDTSIVGMSNSVPACIEVPQFASMTNATTLLDLDDSGEWIATGKHVQKDKLLQIEWSSNGVNPSPNKYRALYRVDPRFPRPQFFIQEYNYSTKKYVSDFHAFKGGQLLRYQAVAEMTPAQRVEDFVDYFDFNGRSKIPVKQDDIIHITLDTSGNYFGSDSEMNTELGSGDNINLIYTQSSLPNNRIIYSNIPQWCSNAITSASSNYSLNCSSYSNQYWDVTTNWKTFLGRINNTAFTTNQPNIDACADGVNGRDNTPLCYYDHGRGMLIKLGGTTIKSNSKKFVHNAFNQKDFFYYKSNIDGDLEFINEWDISNMYGTSLQYMKNWTFDASFTSQFALATEQDKANLAMNFVHFGRYLLDIEIGNYKSIVPDSDLKAIDVEYVIVPSGTPAVSTVGTSAEQYFRTNADKSGFLWLRVTRPNDLMTGSIKVKTANYTGSTWFSDVVYEDLVKPLRTKFNQLSKIIYTKLITDTAFKNIASAMMVLYVLIYGLMFLAGATQVTAIDIVQRVLKISIIVMLFSESSWVFFNSYLFDVFISGADSLMSIVIGTASKSGNVFAFIDPIFDKYTNPTIWGLLFIQLLSLHNGLTFFAIITILGVLEFFKVAIEVIVTYVLAFLSLAVMVSLAPFFIILVLFERTKNMFNNWLSLMFSYMVQPTLLLIIFLMIEHIMDDHIMRTVVRACWGTLIPIKIGLDLNHIGIPLSFSFSLPFLPGIPFYIPVVAPIESVSDFMSKVGTFSSVATSTFMFYALSKLASGIVEYVTLVVTYLTNVIAARQDGRLQHETTPTHSIINDMKKVASPVTGTLGWARNLIKRKVINQEIGNESRRSSRAGVSGENIDYSQVNRGEGGANALPNNPDNGSEEQGDE